MEDKKIVRRGIISTVYPARHSARVTFADNDAVVSAEMPVITPYASKNNLYALPDVGEQVIVLQEENDAQEGDGVIIGSIYSDVNKPKINSQDKFRIDFDGGSFIEFDRKSGNLEIVCKGDIKITGKNIYLN